MSNVMNNEGASWPTGPGRQGGRYVFRRGRSLHPEADLPRETRRVGRLFNISHGLITCAHLRDCSSELELAEAIPVSVEEPFSARAARQS